MRISKPGLRLLFVSSLLMMLTQGQDDESDGDSKATFLHNDEVGPRDRFWRHHAAGKTLMYEGVDHYDAIQGCLDASLTEEDWSAIANQSAEGIRHVQRYYFEYDDDDNEGLVFLVHIRKAILPIHVKAIQVLASCVRATLPHLYESRPMYQEQNLDEDPGLGGNCPTHLAPLVGIFMPNVMEQMYQNLKFAYDAAEWEEAVNQDRFRQYYGKVSRDDAMHAPEHVGVRASEHLTYNDFPALAKHNDGSSTVYTMNYAFSDEYQGGGILHHLERW